MNGQNVEINPSFELVMLVRDADGKPTGSKKLFASDNPSELYDFYQRYKGKPKRKKKKVKKENLPNGNEAEKILKEIYGDN